MLPRRSTTKLAFIAAAFLALGGMQASAQDKPLKKVRLAVGTSFLNVGYPMNTLPLTLGYWKGEGYDVEVLPVGASLQALQQMVPDAAVEISMVDDTLVLSGTVYSAAEGEDVRRIAKELTWATEIDVSSLGTNGTALGAMRLAADFALGSILGESRHPAVVLPPLGPNQRKGALEGA